MIARLRAPAHPRYRSGARRRSPAYPLLVLGGLSVALLLTAVVALALGEEYIPPGAILGMALQWLPVHPARTWSDVDFVIITAIRLPRIATAIVVGGSLGVAGAAFQGLFRNPLADPGIVGTSSGAGLGAMVALALPMQVMWLGFSQVTLLAFAGALGGMVLVYLLARVGGRLPSTSLLLAGFAVSAVLNAASSLVMSLDNRMREMYHWLLGSLIDTTASQLLPAAPLMAVGTIGLLALAGDLNVLLLGDEQSHYLGLRVTQRRVLILVFGSLLTAVAVSLSGIIAFVGLVVPHLARLLFGANHRLLLPASLLLGAIFLLIADTLARMVLAPQELPVGVITALIGAPWFLVLLRRKRGEYTF
ncbi:MAG TPA: iron ABC transporter permease [Chloroflexota bacterium]|nr:iron ABC transporter permease [Chloroflexota bacterium]